MAGELDAGQVLLRSLRIWVRGLVPFTLLCALPVVPVLAMSALVGEPRVTCRGPEEFLPQILACLLWLSTPAAVIHGVLRQLRGERVSLGGCLRVYGRTLPSALGIGVIIGFVGMPSMFACSFAISALGVGASSGALGIATLAVVGALLSCLFWVAVPVAALERRGVFGSMRRSLQLTRGARGAILLVSLATLGIVLVPMFAAIVAGQWPVATVATVLTSSFGAVACAVGYHDLRTAREGVRVEDLEKVFA